MYTQNFPDGSVLVSSALSQDDTTTALQTAICFCLGIDKENDPETAGNTVRQAWPKNGAPAFTQSDNLVFIQASEDDDWYNKVADESFDNVVLQREFTRVWRIHLELRGPLSSRWATQIKTMMQQPTVHDMLATSNLYLIPDVSAATRAPELWESRYWERCDLNLRFNEQVNETLTKQTVTSVEVIVEDADGIQIDLVAQE